MKIPILFIFSGGHYSPDIYGDSGWFVEQYDEFPEWETDQWRYIAIVETNKFYKNQNDIDFVKTLDELEGFENIPYNIPGEIFVIQYEGLKDFIDMYFTDERNAIEMAKKLVIKALDDGKDELSFTVKRMEINKSALEGAINETSNSTFPSDDDEISTNWIAFSIYVFYDGDKYHLKYSKDLSITSSTLNIRENIGDEEWRTMKLEKGQILEEEEFSDLKSLKLELLRIR